MTSGHGTPQDGPRGPRRPRPRRATGGRAPDPELAVDDPVLRSLPREAPEDAAERGTGASERDRERWLRQQRPPHWG